MSFLLNSIMLFGLGIMSFLVLVPIAAALLPWHTAQHITRPYQKLAMALVKSGLMIQRSHGTYSFKKAKYDPKVNAMYVRMGGEKQYYEDPNNYISTLYGYTFGLAYEHENGAVITTPRLCYVAERFRELKQTGEWIKNGARKAVISIPRDLRLVKPSMMKYIVQKSASPRAVTRSRTYAEKSQAGFDSPNYVDTMTWIMTLGAAMGLMWLASEFSSMGGGGGGTILPMVLEVGVVIG